jgi:L-ascorbate metabolism protein UlaG (beta-lactamase superfamily)
MMGRCVRGYDNLNDRMKTAFGARARGVRLERMMASPRWVDGTFRNVHPMLPNLREPVRMPTITEFLMSNGRRVPPAPLPLIDPRPAWRVPGESGLRVTWIGHSTLVIEVDGVTVLTDPVWGARSSPFRVAGPRRFQPPPVTLDELPPVDVIVLSHDHFDHLDFPTWRTLASWKTPVVTSLGVGAHLEAWGVRRSRITELDWWEKADVPGVDLEITATPAQHFSGRTIHGRNSTLWSSFVLRGSAHSVFFGADTGLTTLYGDIAARFGPFDVAMLEIGAYHPAWGDIHLGPDNAITALAMLGNPPFLPIHWGTFNLAMHAWDAPVERVMELAPDARITMLIPQLGQPIEPAAAALVDPWWRSVAKQHRRKEATVVEGAAPRANWPLD